MIFIILPLLIFFLFVTIKFGFALFLDCIGTFISSILVIAITLIPIPGTRGVPTGPNVIINFIAMLVVGIISMIFTLIYKDLYTGLIVSFIGGFLFNTWLWFFSDDSLFWSDWKLCEYEKNKEDFCIHILTHSIPFLSLNCFMWKRNLHFFFFYFKKKKKKMKSIFIFLLLIAFCHAAVTKDIKPMEKLNRYLKHHDEYIQNYFDVSKKNKILFKHQKFNKKKKRKM